MNYGGKTLTQCLKMESATSIAFTAPAAGTLTLVFESLKVTEAEQETYFGQVLRDLDVYNAKGLE